MKVEYVYRCKRCGKEIIIPLSGDFHVLSEAKQDILTDNQPSNHYCTGDKHVVGKLEMIGMNIRE